MDKKLQKYIERYDTIEACKSYALISNGGMIVLLNQETSYEITIEHKTYPIEPFQTILLNTYENAIAIDSPQSLNLIAIRFKGAGASFFYEAQMPTLMQSPKEPIFIEQNIPKETVESYLKNRLTPSKLPFNMMKIIALLDQQGNAYSIDEILAIANIPRKILDKIFNLRTGLTFKAYARVREVNNKL